MIIIVKNYFCEKLTQEAVIFVSVFFHLMTKDCTQSGVITPSQSGLVSV